MQRFISEDPIRLRGGINYFSYVRNNPAIHRDPHGLLIAQTIGGVVGGGFGAYSAYESGQDATGIIESAAIGALSGVLSTIPIPGVNPLLSGSIMGAGAGLLGNVGTQLFTSTPCSNGIKWGSAGLSALAGGLGGIVGSGAAGITSSQSLPIFTNFGQDVISSSIAGITGGVLDALLH